MQSAGVLDVPLAAQVKFADLRAVNPWSGLEAEQVQNFSRFH
jgi:hypothetical protein